MTLDEAREHIGAGVVYRPGDGRVEDGTVVSVNDRYVMVRYVGDRTAKATDPAQLTLLAGVARCSRAVTGERGA